MSASYREEKAPGVGCFQGVFRGGGAQGHWYVDLIQVNDLTGLKRLHAHYHIYIMLSPITPHRRTPFLLILCLPIH
jgi:hypothetical protein